MAPSTPGSSNIVETWTTRGLPTGDFYAQTADGTVWRVYQGGAPSPGTGKTPGVYYGDRIERR